jgi:hypothetical protein
MNEMIEVRHKPRESIWDIDQKFKTLKSKMKCTISDMQHRQLFINSLLPHFKYPLRQHKFQNQAETLQAVMQLEESQYKQIDPTIKKLKEDLKNLTVQLNQNKSREKRESMWCTLCISEGHHKNVCLKFVKYLE